MNELQSRLFFPILFILYLFAHGSALLHSGIYWDDWLLVQVPPSEILWYFAESGRPILGYFHHFMVSLPHAVLIYKIAIFAFYFLSAGLFYAVLRLFKQFREDQRRMLALVFCLFPLNSSRQSIVILQYVLCLTAFLGGLWLILKFQSEKWTVKILTRIAGLSLFLLSFIIEAHVVFFAAILPFLIFDLWHQKSSVMRKPTFRTIFRNTDLLLAPFLFWAIKSVFFQPRGIYLGLNSFTGLDVLVAPFKSLKSFHSSFLLVIGESWQQLYSPYIVVPLGLIALTFPNLVNRSAVEKHAVTRQDYILLLFGVYLFLVAAFPFVLVGKPPKSTDWLGRSQVLLPFGVSFLIVFGIPVLIREKYRFFLFALFIAIFTHANFSIGFEYWKDWYKQLSLIENFKTNTTIRDATTFLIDDRVPEFNARSRSLRYFEYSALMKTAYGTENRFAVNANEYEGMQNFEFAFSRKAAYAMADYVPRAPQYSILITKGKTPLMTHYEVARLWLLQWTDSEVYWKQIREILALKVT